MKQIIFITSAIDVLLDKGIETRKEFSKIICSCGYYAISAGLGDNPIINTNNSLLAKKRIIALGLQQVKKAQITLAITDLKTFAVGTWIELWIARQLGQYIILFITNKNPVKNIFLTGLVDKIIHNDVAELKKVLKSL